MIDLLKKIFINQVFWYVASRYGIMALQFIASLFTAVRLGVYNYGLWSFITLLTTLGGCLNLGIGNAATVFLVQNKKSRRLTNAYTCNSFFLACLTGALSFSVLLYDRLFGITLFEKYHLGFYIYFVCSIIFFQQICTYFINIMRIQNKLFPIMFFQSLWPLCMLAVLFMAEGKALLHLLVWSLLLTSVISSVIFFQQAKIFWQDFLNLRLIERILKKGIFMFFFNTCFLMITYSTQLIISNHFSVKEFGYFSFALILANGIILLVDSIIFILYPKLMDVLNKKENAAILQTIKSLRSKYLTCIYIIFLTAMTGQFLFFHIFRQYYESMFLFGMILCSLISYSGCFGYNIYLIVKNQEKFIALAAVAALLLNIGGLLVLTKVMNLSIGFSLLSTLISYQIYSLIINAYALKKLQVNRTNFIREMVNWDFSLVFWMTFFCFVLEQSAAYMLLPWALFLLLFGKSAVAIFKETTAAFTDESILKI